MDNDNRLKPGEAIMAHFNTLAKVEEARCKAMNQALDMIFASIPTQTPTEAELEAMAKEWGIE